MRRAEYIYIPDNGADQSFAGESLGFNLYPVDRISLLSSVNLRKKDRCLPTAIVEADYEVCLTILKFEGAHELPVATCRAAVTAERLPCSVQATASVEPAGICAMRNLSAIAASGPLLSRTASRPCRTSWNMPSPPTWTINHTKFGPGITQAPTCLVMPLLKGREWNIAP